ncbi:MAG: hypothetical protein QXK51_04835 [Candidatus Methanomethylicia archaeon]
MKYKFGNEHVLMIIKSIVTTNQTYIDRKIKLRIHKEYKPK